MRRVARHPARPAETASAQRGVTLVELMIVLAVAALLGAAALPSMATMLGRHRLQAAARHLQADLALARQEALRHGRVAHLVFEPGANWCYALSLGVASGCQPGSAGVGSALLKLVRADQYPDVVLVDAGAMALDARDGTSLLGQGQASFVSLRGDRLTVHLSHLGRAALCAPAAPIAGLPPCRTP